MNEEKDQITDHEYDGIREYNNPLPTWWLATFLASIIFAFLYYIHYELGGAPSMQEDLQAALAVIEKQHPKIESAPLSDSEIAQLISQADIGEGEKQFKSKCAACHGAELQGGIGPNLTDAYWLHGKGSGKELIEVIKTGVLEKGMPAWSAMLKDGEIMAIVSFILARQDSNPAGAKAPQGEKAR